MHHHRQHKRSPSSSSPPSSDHAIVVRPARVPALAHMKITHVSCGAEHTLALSGLLISLQIIHNSISHVPFGEDQTLIIGLHISIMSQLYLNYVSIMSQLCLNCVSIMSQLCPLTQMMGKCKRLKHELRTLGV